MADLGTLGTAWEIEAAPRVAQGGFPGPRELVIWGETTPMVFGAGKSISEGTPSAPSLYMPKGGSIQFRLPVSEGTRTLSVFVKQPDPTISRPTMRVSRNDEIGVANEIIATAPAGVGWVEIGPITFTASTDGGVLVTLSSGLSYGIAADCWFDSLTVA